MQGRSLVMLLSVLYGSAFLAGFNENLVNMALMSIMGDFGVDSVTAAVAGHGLHDRGDGGGDVAWRSSIGASSCARCSSRPAALSIAGSAAGLFAGSFAVLLVARLVQAVGTGIFIPLMMNTILAVTPKNRLGVVHVHRRVHDHVRAGLRPGGVRGRS